MQVSNKYIFTSLVLGSVSIIHAETLTVNAKVDEVTLYTNQADIVSKASVDITEPGQHQLLISGLLSNSIEEIAIDVQGAELVSQSVIAGDKLNSTEQLSALAQAQQQLKMVQRALSDNAKLSTALANSLENADTDIDNVKERIATLRSEYEQLLRQEQSINEDIHRLNKLIDWRGENQEQDLQQSLLLNINAEQAGEINLSLRERSSNAYWQPMSQWQLNSETSEIDIVGQAKISQMTGSDWDNVAITLAIMPIEYYYLPEFVEQSVSYNQSKLSKGGMSVDYAEPMVESFAEPAMVNMRKDSMQPIVVENGGNFQVTMPTKYHLASGQDSYLLTYYHEQVQADETYSAFYSWDWPQKALLVAEWTQPGELPLLPGEMKLYRDELFLTNLYDNDLFQPGADFAMSFGVDARIEVEVIAPPEYKENNGFISRDRLVKKEETLSLTNHGKESLPVRIYARLPVSTEESIEIKPTWSPKPDMVDVNDVKGIVYWARELAAEEKLSVEQGYEIRHPEDKSIITSQ